MSNHEKLRVRAIEFLKGIGVEVPWEDEDSLDEMMRVIETRANRGDAQCEEFLEKEVPWEDLEIPDPLGWANRY